MWCLYKSAMLGGSSEGGWFSFENISCAVVRAIFSFEDFLRGIKRSRGGCRVGEGHEDEEMRF